MTPEALAGDAKAAMPAVCINFLREMFISVLLNSNLSTRVAYVGAARSKNGIAFGLRQAYNAISGGGYAASRKSA
jgi:hypothetical protein